MRDKNKLQQNDIDCFLKRHAALTPVHQTDISQSFQTKHTSIIFICTRLEQKRHNNSLGFFHLLIYASMTAEFLSSYSVRAGSSEF